MLRADPAQPVDRALRVFYCSTAKGETFVEQILAGNGRLLRPNGTTTTTAQLLATVGTDLQPGLAEATQLAAQLGQEADNLPGDPGEEPPWMAVARQQLAVVEDKDCSNPKIEKYFTAMGMSSARDDTAWCAAFVSWCMANCGNTRVANGNRRSARSARSADWM